MKPVIFLNSHPIQYFVPLYQKLAQETSINLQVWYCSEESVKENMDKGFGQIIQWDIPLLKGYDHVFLKNNAIKPSIHAGFFGLMNFGIITRLYKQPRSIIVIHGWAYLTHIIAIIFGNIFGHKICLRAETPLNQELLKSKGLLFIKNICLRFLFLFVNRFLYIGKQNKLFYQSLGVPVNKLLFTPYSVDNDRFRSVYLTVSKEQARVTLQLPQNKKIILFSGKYIIKKRPLDLLKAFALLKQQDALLVFAGEGALRKEMEMYISENNLTETVFLTGFVNQTQIPIYYRAADLFVMCSGSGETWGLSVNEALNFGLPVIVSDLCGCADDLVEEGVNGSIFTTGDITALSEMLYSYLNKPPSEIESITAASLKKADLYSYEKVISTLLKEANEQ